LAIPSSSFTVGYTGHLYPGRGIELILDIAEQLLDINFLLVGGETEDIERVRQEAQIRDLNNIFLAGFIPNSKLPEYQAACDIFIMPYQRSVAASSGGDISKYLSPMKLFEYMASCRGIISSNLPVLQEILNAKNSILLPPDDLTSWVATIQNVREKPERYAHLADHARQDVQRYSWNIRAQKILSTVET
jgi:glycosyltransferase involved in cell wall biosynthesis